MVTVAFVNVALVPIRLIVFVLTKFDVVAFDVEALEVAKLDVVPNNVVIVASVEVNVLMKPVAKAVMLPVMLVTVVEAKVDEPELEIFVELTVVKFAFVADRLVVVEFVIVPFATLIEGSVKFVTERFVTVADVRVAFPPEILAFVIFAVAIFEVVELVVEAFTV